MTMTMIPLIPVDPKNDIFYKKIMIFMFTLAWDVLGVPKKN